MTNILLDKKNLKASQLQMLIVRAVQEVLSDPDFGLELTVQARKRLREAQKAKIRKTISLEEIKRKYL